MTNFSLENKVESIIITGITTSYLLINKGIYKALKSISDNLKSGGIISFDFTDASRFFKEIKNGLKVQHMATARNTVYVRNSFMRPNHELDNFMFNWNAIYYKNTINKDAILTKDTSTVRAFAKDE